MNTTISPHDIHLLLHAEHDDPFGVLGLHQIDQVWVVRSLRPDAKELTIVDRHNVGRRFPATRIAEEGLFEAQLEGVSEALEYLVELTTWPGETFQISDPYSYGPILGELDMHLYKVGNHYEIYEKLGAHLTEIKGHAGVSFAVWAPMPNGSAWLAILTAGMAAPIRWESASKRDLGNIHPRGWGKRSL
jgi:1,4-alpha-glucan branching enzyme